MPTAPVSALALLLLAGCTVTPPPTAGRAQNPASPAAAESPRPPYVPPPAAPTSGSPEAAPSGDEHHASSPGTESREAVTYTCPMHPEVRSSEPGVCPKCGMTLVPVEKEHGTP